MNKKLLFKKKSGINIFVKHFAISIGYAVILLLCLVYYFFVTHKCYSVVGESMLPTIQSDGQGAYVGLESEYTYSDIVVCYNDEHTRLIKRLIAFGGDKIGYYYNSEIEFYEVAVIYKDSQTVEILQEDYVSNKDGNAISYNNFITKNLDEKIFEFIEYENQLIQFLVIPDGYVYILGDNRAVSRDCSTYGALSDDFMIGKVELIVTYDYTQVFTIIGYLLGIRSN